MEKAVGYEIRRRIRAQIRVVKRLITEGKLSTITTITKLKSVNKDSPKSAKNQTQTEYQMKFTTKSAPESKKADNKLFSHTDIISKKDTSEKVSEYQSSYTYDEQHSSEQISRRSRSRTPEEKSILKNSTTERNTFKPELKKANSGTKTTIEEKPEWVTQRNLKKVTTTNTGSGVKVTTTIKKSQESNRGSSIPKEGKITDVITSSYGVGPLDENGTPLFGLKALRTRNTKKTGLPFHYSTLFY